MSENGKGQNCTKCSHFFMPPGTALQPGAMGLCRRFPPVPIPLGLVKVTGGQSMATTPVYPMVDKTFWCGEWKANVIVPTLG